MPEDNEPQPSASGSDDVALRANSGGAESENASDPITGALKDAPLRIQQEFSQFLAIAGQTSNPVREKFNAEHIHKVLDYREAGNQRDHQQAYSTRRFALAFFFIALVAVVGVLVFLVWQGERELAGQILAGLAIFGGGFGSGYGLGKRR